MNYFLVILFVLGSFEFSVKAIPITEQIYFYHYSSKNQINGTELKIGQELSKTINRKLPWKFFIHGWTTDPKVSPWYREGKDAYFTKNKYNIVFVDWSIPGNQTYLQSVKNAIGSGEYVSKFLLHLVQNGVSLKDIHLLGHSLGSHMSGFCGKSIINATNGTEKIGRITGLDPAGPFYELNTLAPIDVNKNFIKSILKPSNLRLDKDDAHFVDVIHTDSGRYGIQSNIGHVDFHPNGGRRIQPGCETTDDENCSHARAPKFFIESINNNNFVALECPSYENYQDGCCEENKSANLGEYTDASSRGNFYLMTNAEPPYAKGAVKRSISDVCKTNAGNFQGKTTKLIYYITVLIALKIFYFNRF